MNFPLLIDEMVLLSVSQELVAGTAGSSAVASVMQEVGEGGYSDLPQY